MNKKIVLFLILGSNCGDLGSAEKMKLCLIHGGMDTEGEVFDDTLVIRVS